MGKSIKTSNEVYAVIKKVIDTGNWIYETGSKHDRLRHLPTNRIVTFPSSTSDNARAALNFQKSIRHVEQGRPGWGHPR